MKGSICLDFTDHFSWQFSGHCLTFFSFKITGRACGLSTVGARLKFGTARIAFGGARLTFGGTLTFGWARLTFGWARLTFGIARLTFDRALVLLQNEPCNFYTHRIKINYDRSLVPDLWYSHEFKGAGVEGGVLNSPTAWFR